MCACRCRTRLEQPRQLNTYQPGRGGWVWLLGLRFEACPLRRGLHLCLGARQAGRFRATRSEPRMSLKGRRPTPGSTRRAAGAIAQPPFGSAPRRSALLRPATLGESRRQAQGSPGARAIRICRPAATSAPPRARAQASPRHPKTTAQNSVANSVARSPEEETG
jgi:hypothetical protein